MRALVCHKITDDLSGVAVRDVDRPAPGDGDVLIKVHATSINFPDILLCQGKYQLKLEPPFTPGMDVAGTIEAVGANVEGFSVGDAVCGGARFGGFAEYALLQADGLQHKPDRLSFEEAASYSAAYLTAYVSLVRRGRLQAGETLLVHGASGGVGMAAVNGAAVAGAGRIIAVDTNPAKLQTAAMIGATDLINPNDYDPVEQIKSVDVDG